MTDIHTYSIYDVASGVLTGAQISTTSAGAVPAEIPPGCGLVLGAWDCEVWIVDHASGALVPREAPPADWRIRKGAMADAQLQIIATAEASHARPLRDILAAQLAGTPAAADDLAMFHSLKASIDSARARYLAILAAQTPEALDAI